jgi:hypothetical protein
MPCEVFVSCSPWCYHDYSTKALHKDAKEGNTVKLKILVNRAEGKETVGNQKWIKKEAVIKEEGESESPSQPKKQTEASP